MKLPALGSRERRALVTGICVIVAVAGLKFLPAVRAAHRGMHGAVDAAARELHDARAAIAEAPSARDSLDARARRLVGWAPRLLPATTGSEASAELATFAATLAVPHRVRIATTRALPDTVRSLFVEASVVVEATSDIAGLAGWLAALGEGRRLVTVRRLAIDAAAPTSPSNQPEELRAELVLSALAIQSRDSTRRGR